MDLLIKDILLPYPKLADLCDFSEGMLLLSMLWLYNEVLNSNRFDLGKENVLEEV